MTDDLKKNPFLYAFFFFKVKARLIKMGHLNSMNIFLRQEIDRMQKVISILRSSLSDLKLAIEGTIIMSEVSYDLNFHFPLLLVLPILIF